MALTPAERETIITWDDEDKRVHVHTSQRTMITRLLRIPGVEIVEDTKHDGSRMVSAILPEGSITLRSKAKGMIKRNGTQKTAMPNNAPRCSATKADGSPCRSIANKTTGRCSKHPL